MWGDDAWFATVFDVVWGHGFVQDSKVPSHQSGKTILTVMLKQKRAFTKLLPQSWDQGPSPNQEKQPKIPNKSKPKYVTRVVHTLGVIYRNIQCYKITFVILCLFAEEETHGIKNGLVPL